MGADKAFLELAGKPLILRAIEVAREAVAVVKIVGDPRKFAAFGPVIEDVYHDRGPLGGIHAALTNSEAEWNLILAVDLPFVPAQFLKYLLARATCRARRLRCRMSRGISNRFARCIARHLYPLRTTLYPKAKTRSINSSLRFRSAPFRKKT